ncbi:MAG TPA: alpha/beta hydrolase [Pseudomonadales bacterium]|nr:alpha/beta hydrolase [Pseudomonadales bacterium]
MPVEKSTPDNTLQPPSLWWSLLEAPRAALEISSLGLKHRELLDVPRGDGHPVLVLPGYGAGDAIMYVMRYYLGRWGYDARPWNLGVNFTRSRITAIDQINAFRADMEDKVAARIAEIYHETGQKVSVIGWSLGGIYANSMADRVPEYLRHVITLGAPYGDPRGTAAWNVLKAVNFSSTPESEQDFDGWLNNDASADRVVKTTVIYSPNDGIVAEAAARLGEHDSVDHVPVNSSHVGFAFNPAVYRIIAETLAQN